MLMGHISLPIIERLTSTTGATAEARALAIWSAIGVRWVHSGRVVSVLGIGWQRAQPHSWKLEVGGWELTGVAPPVGDAPALSIPAVLDDWTAGR